MKKFKTVLLGVALLAGISGAIATKVQATPKADEDRYNWTSNSNAPSHPNASLPNATIGEAKANFGCSGGGATCADGVDPNEVLDPVTIQLN
ncbi:hypothetical protein ACFQZS_03695 [Mucilaginibacter calamicampi]|uniref:Uncharacterized protein n=1 Tax=Mucilaginibacter calamicampi TaxID=1302352 RepID=A0ABW2YS44_9SPHI